MTWLSFDKLWQTTFILTNFCSRLEIVPILSHLALCRGLPDCSQLVDSCQRLVDNLLRGCTEPVVVIRIWGTVSPNSLRFGITSCWLDWNFWHRFFVLLKNSFHFDKSVQLYWFLSFWSIVKKRHFQYTADNAFELKLHKRTIWKSFRLKYQTFWQFYIRLILLWKIW